MEEVNFDGLVGPTHNYAGLSYGNLASMTSKEQVANPKAAALEGLKKMKLLMDLGVPQGVIPPLQRPATHILKTLGYNNLDNINPLMLATFSSASSMWTANAATLTPSCDSHDGKVHLTIANLQSQLHRSIESDETYALFKRLFPAFEVHPPLLKGGHFGDEGAANHTRLGDGTHLFVYGMRAFEPVSTRFPARQSLEASEAIARRHQVKKPLFIRQNPELIDQGVFHNDVIAVGHQDLFLYHEKAYVDLPDLPVQTIRVTEQMLPVKQAIKTYLFNSQIVTTQNQELALIAPAECEQLDLSWLPINNRYFVNLKQSMQNGGGPACLRLRFLLNEEEVKTTKTLLTKYLYKSLVNWVDKHYRDRLAPKDLSDPLLIKESYEALDELTEILQLPKLYPFQN